MKFMNMKRFGSIAMAGALALSLTVPAFAGSATTQPANSTKITGGYEDIPVSVEVPTTGEAQLNPYGLPVTITKSDEKTVDLVGQKITTKPLSIKNQGTTALDVGASLAVVPKGEVSIAASADNDKAIKVDLEVVGLDDATLAVASTNTKLDDMLIEKFAAAATWAGASTLAAPAAAAGATTVTALSSPDNAPLATLGAATLKGDIVNYSKNSIALFRLTGDLAQSPKTGTTNPVANPWETTDGFEATIVFKFVPAPTRSAVTIGDVTGGTNVSIAADKTIAAAGETVTLTGTNVGSTETITYTVTGASGATVTVTPESNPDNATFVMPAEPVTVTASVA